MRVGSANQADERHDGEGDQTVSQKIPWSERNRSQLLGVIDRFQGDAEGLRG